MSSFNDTFQNACDTREIPGVVLLANDNTGNFEFQRVFGSKSPAEPMNLDATFALASCTKLMTSIAALQCVERGQIGLDDDVSNVLTEFKDINIITGFDDRTNQTIMSRAKTPITLRHLLTHTSGFGYDALRPEYQRWRSSRGETGATLANMRMHQRISLPLLFEPGSNWTYGHSYDWIGLLIGRLNNTSLEEYMRAYIWDPLGIKSMTFHLNNHLEVKQNLVKMSRRGGAEDQIWAFPTRDDLKVVWSDKQLINPSTEDETGGGGVVSTATDFMKVLKSIGGDDGILLKSSTIDELFTPQLSGNALDAYLQAIALPFQRDAFASHKPGMSLNYGLSGELVMSDEETGRRKGTMSWSGLPNLLWTIDREAGLNLFYASQVMPFGDYKSGMMQRIFETEVYRQFGQRTSVL